MKKINQLAEQLKEIASRKTTKLLLLLVVLGAAFFVRFWKFEYLPYVTDGDELAYVFAGQSLVQYGVPISWSSFEMKELNWMSAAPTLIGVESKEVFTFNRPWLDHMYFIPVWSGVQSTLAGYLFPTIPPALFYRLPFIFCSWITIVLVFLIARKHFGFYPAIGAVILAGMSPMLFIGQRMVVSENILTIWFLLAYYFYQEKQSVWYLVIITCLAAITKITGAVLLPLLVVAFLLEKKYKTAALFAVSSVLGIAILIGVYAAHLDWNTFWVLIHKQSFRLIGWSNPAFLFSHPGFHTKSVLDFSYYMLLTGGLAIFNIQKEKEYSMLKFWIIILFAVIWLTGAEQDMLGWYKLPVFSFLTIASASLFKEKLYLPLLLLLITTVISNLGLVRFPGHEFPEALNLRLVVASGILLYLIVEYTGFKKELQKYLVVALLLIYVMQGFYIADQYFSALCKDRICPTPTITLKSFVSKLTH